MLLFTHTESPSIIKHISEMSKCEKLHHRISEILYFIIMNFLQIANSRSLGIRQQNVQSVINGDELQWGGLQWGGLQWRGLQWRGLQWGVFTCAYLAFRLLHCLSRQYSKTPNIC